MRHSDDGTVPNSGRDREGRERERGGKRAEERAEESSGSGPETGREFQKERVRRRESSRAVLQQGANRERVSVSPPSAAISATHTQYEAGTGKERKLEKVGLVSEQSRGCSRGRMRESRQTRVRGERWSQKERLLITISTNVNDG